MKVFIYNYRDFDEAIFFEKYSKEFDMEIKWTQDPPSLDNAHLAKGCDAISIITSKIDEKLMDEFKKIGIKIISTRTIGYDHIDLFYAKKIGMAVTHISYDPETVADYTVMSIIMGIRKIDTILRKNRSGDFRLNGLMGRRLADCTVGIIGAGKTGSSVIRDLSGFGCTILYYSRNRKKNVEKYAKYVDLETLLKESDVVSLHLELNSETKHIINKNTLSKMKKNAVIVNTARGPLIDTESLVLALSNNELGGAVLDVVEDEFGLYYNDCSSKDLNETWAGKLRDFPNVFITHHMAFYSEKVISDMVYNCLYGLKCFDEGKEVPLRLV